MSRVRVKPLSRRAARELIDSLSGRLDDALTRRLLVDAYILSDGRVVLVDWESPQGTLYPDIESLQAILSDTSTESRHILADVLPNGKGFPDAAESLI